jgi:hypothetical protein
MSSTYSNLKFEIIGTGEQQGLWGQTTNANIGTAIEQALVGMATLEAADFTANVCTLTLINTNAAQDARALCLNLDAAALSAAGTINVPAIQKPYIVINNTTHAVTVKVSGLTGVTIPAGKRSVVYNNGTDIGEQITYLTNLTIGTLGLANALPVASGGTGSTTASAARTALGLAIGTDVPSPTGTGASGTWAIAVTGNAATATSSTRITNAGGWNVTPSGTKLFFNYNGTNVGSLDSSGNFIVSGNVTGYGTP